MKPDKPGLWWARRHGAKNPVLIDVIWHERFVGKILCWWADGGRWDLDSAVWIAPCLPPGTVIEGKRPTREQNERLEAMAGFWTRAMPGHGVMHIGAPFGESITFRGLEYSADGSIDPDAIWHALDARGYPVRLEGE